MQFDSRKWLSVGEDGKSGNEGKRYERRQPIEDRARIFDVHDDDRQEVHRGAKEAREEQGEPPRRDGFKQEVSPQNYNQKNA
jgi:hypothetical protein